MKHLIIDIISRGRKGDVEITVTDEQFLHPKEIAKAASTAYGRSVTMVSYTVFGADRTYINGYYPCSCCGLPQVLEKFTSLLVTPAGFTCGQCEAK